MLLMTLIQIKIVFGMMMLATRVKKVIILIMNILTITTLILIYIKLKAVDE